MANLKQSLNLNLSDIARLIQSKGRRGDTMLAHINPREAALLKSYGGSGTVNPDTGLPEFYDGFDFAGSAASNILDQPAQFQTPGASDVLSQPAQFSEAPVITSQPYTGTGINYETTPTTFGELSPNVGRPEISAFPTAPSSLALQPSSVSPTTAQEPSISDQVSKYFSGEKGLERALRLGGTALTTGMGLSAGRRGTRQAEQMRREIEAQAKPYYEKGQEYIRRGQTGELLPAQQQAIDAQRAQAAQARTRAGVGADSTMAAQQEATIQRQSDLFRQQLIDYGFQLTGVADQITQKAISAGYSADKDAQAAASRFYAAALGLAVPSPVKG